MTSSEVTPTLDRVALSNRAAAFIIAATANALGYDISRMLLSGLQLDENGL